MAPLI
jgi:hypothetical protein